MKISEFNQMMKESFGDRVINIPSTEEKKIDQYELMEHYDFYVEDEEENGNTPLNYNEWYREFGDKIKQTIKRK